MPTPLPMFLEKPFTLSNYHYFFDETNNIRALNISYKNQKLNDNEFPFVLGGIFLKDNYDEKKLKKKLFNRFDSTNIKIDGEELKFSEFQNNGNGQSIQKFKKLLASKKLNQFFHWLKKENINIHYNTIDISYFYFIDFIDDMVMCNLANNKFPPSIFNRDYQISTYFSEIKSEFYNFFVENKDFLIKGFYTSGFPKITDDSLQEIKDILLNRMENNTKLKHKKDISHIIQKNDLFFLKEDQENILIKDFSVFYLTKIHKFKSSKITLDNELKVEEIINTFLKNEKNRSYLIDIYKADIKFTDSKHSFLIQCADIVIGFVREIYKISYIQVDELSLQEDIFTLKEQTIDKKFNEFINALDLNDLQKDTLITFINIHKRSLTIFNGNQETLMPLNVRLFFDRFLII